MVSCQRSYRCRSFVILIVIGAFLYRDISKHGSWEKSSVHKALKDYGILNYTNQALDRSREGLQWLHVRIDEQFPGYYEKSAEVLKPYSQLSRDLGLITWNNIVSLKEAIVEKYYPALVSTVDTYAPGFYEASQKAVVDAWSASKGFCNNTIVYLKKEVFVGQLAPENLQRIVVEAFNNAQKATIRTINWIYEKVQSSIK